VAAPHRIDGLPAELVRRYQPHSGEKARGPGVLRAEARDWPHARSARAVESLARWRGASVGAQAAEAFMLIRELT